MAFDNHICLLNAVTGNTTSPWHLVLAGTYSLQVVLTGSPSGGTVTLEGSNNGSTADTTAAATFTIGTDASGVTKFVVDKPYAYIRAKLASLTGGTNPTVSAFFAAITQAE